jgi:hypothetical protein
MGDADYANAFGDHSRSFDHRLRYIRVRQEHGACSERINDDISRSTRATGQLDVTSHDLDSMRQRLRERSKGLEANKFDF